MVDSFLRALLRRTLDKGGRVLLDLRFGNWATGGWHRSCCHFIVVIVVSLLNLAYFLISAGSLTRRLIIVIHLTCVSRLRYIMDRLIVGTRVQVFRGDLSPCQSLCLHELLHVLVNIVDFAFATGVWLAGLDGGCGAHLVIIYGDVDLLDAPKTVLARIHKAGGTAIPSNCHSVSVDLVFDRLAYPYEITFRLRNFRGVTLCRFLWSTNDNYLLTICCRSHNTILEIFISW